MSFCPFRSWLLSRAFSLKLIMVRSYNLIYFQGQSGSSSLEALGWRAFYVGFAVCLRCGLAPNLCDEISLRRQCYHWVWAQIWVFLSRTHTVIDCSLKHHQDCLVRLPEADSMRLGVVGRAVTCYEWLWLPALWVFSLGTFGNPTSPAQAKERGPACSLWGCFSISSSKPSPSL